MTAVFEFHVVRTDVLRYAAGLTCDDVGLADIVQKRGLTVIDMTHYGDDWCARNEVGLIVGLLMYSFGDVGADIFCLESELLCDEVDGLGIHALVYAHHDTDAHTGGNNLSDRHIHHVGQLVGRHEFRQLQNLCLLLYCFHLGLHLGADAVALLAAILGTLAKHLVLAGGEAGEGLAYLLCHLLLALLYEIYHGLLGLVLLTAVLAFALRLLSALAFALLLALAFSLTLLLAFAFTLA